jgi:hypothetical protein
MLRVPNRVGGTSLLERPTDVAATVHAGQQQSNKSRRQKLRGYAVRIGRFRNELTAFLTEASESRPAKLGLL